MSETVYQSGISTLFNGEQMHDSHYKHMAMTIEKTTEGETKYLELKWKIAYVTQLTEREVDELKDDDNSKLNLILKTKTKELVRCLICEDSMILRAFTDGDGFDTIYQSSTKILQEQASVELKTIFNSLI